MTRIVRCILLAALLFPAIAAAQKPLALAKPDAEYAEPFSNIAGIRELKDGRVLVSDSRDKILQIIAFGGAAAKVGREGAGPGELGIPQTIVALPGDTSAVWDPGNVRYLLVHPDGKPGKEFRLEPASGPGRQQFGLSTRTAPRGVDARGNIYYQGSAFQLSAAGDLVPSDSSPVIRFDRTALRVDTVAYIRLAKGTGSVRTMPNGSTQVLQGGANPLEPRDDWVTLPDGRIAVVRGADYHIDFFASKTAKTSGAPAPYEKFKVNDAIKEWVAEERARAMRNAVGVTSGRGGAPPRADLPPGRGPLTLGEWPEVTPAFMAGAAIARPAGSATQVWVLHVQRPGTDTPVYDVFDLNGRVIGRVQLPANARLVGFGEGTVYVVRADDDDLQYLQRFRLAMGAKLSG